MKEPEDKQNKQDKQFPVVAKPEELSPSKMMDFLDWIYEKAIIGAMGTDSAEALAEEYLRQEGSLRDQVNSLIRWQNAKSTTSGFITGLGGFTAMPVTLPANITSVIYVQVRMIAAIAHMGGYNIKDDRVKTLVYVALCGSAVKDILKNVGINFSTKLTTRMIEKYITLNVLTQINKAVGFRLVTKFGQKGLINFGRAVPLIGGIVGGTFDGMTTNIIGNTARDMFIKDESLI